MTPKLYFMLLKTTAKKWVADKGPRLGASVAFYSMLSLGPLLLLLLSAAAMIYGPEAAHGHLLHQINGLIGNQGARAVQDMLAAADKESSGIWASILGLCTLLVGASGVFGELQDALNGIWKVKAPKTGGIITFLRHRFLSFTMVLGTGFLLLTSLALSSILAALSETSAGFFGSTLLMALINGAVSFFVITLLFAGIFKYMPDIHIRWRNVWHGAALTAALFSLGKFAIGLYIGQSALSTAYGAGGSLVVILVWVYYSAQILYFGAEFTQVYTEYSEKQKLPPAKSSKSAKGRAPK